jgi:hypothetical protein
MLVDIAGLSDSGDGGSARQRGLEGQRGWLVGAAAAA